jgi:hypothetical protein
LEVFEPWLHAPSFVTAGSFLLFRTQNYIAPGKLVYKLWRFDQDNGVQDYTDTVSLSPIRGLSSNGRTAYYFADYDGIVSLYETNGIYVQKHQVLADQALLDYSNYIFPTSQAVYFTAVTPANYEGKRIF